MRTKNIENLAVGVIIIGVAALIVLVAGCRSTVFGHDHGGMQYDQECCHNQDCAPVIRSELVVPSLQASLLWGSPAVPTLWVETVHGRAPIEQSTKRKESRDHRMHACLRPDDRGTMKVICVYEQPGH